MTLELKIGEIEEPKTFKDHYGHWKFVVSKKDQSLLLYAVTERASPDHALAHRDVVNKFNLSNILGGGELIFSLDELKIEGISSVFGYVPNEVAEKFGKLLLPIFEKKYDVQKATVNMCYWPDLAEKNKEELKLWTDLGYTFDTTKRILK